MGREKEKIIDFFRASVDEEPKMSISGQQVGLQLLRTDLAFEDFPAGSPTPGFTNTFFKGSMTVIVHQNHRTPLAYLLWGYVKCKILS